MQLFSKRLVASYVLDWVVIIALAAIGGGLNFVKPKRRPFSLLDLELSFPAIQETITTSTLVLVSVLAPAVLIVAVVAILVPGPSARKTLKRAQAIRRKLWEIETSLAGLALSVALAFFITQGLKNLFGKPRPHLIAVCQPDLSNITEHVVGGFGQDISSRWTLVDSSICQQPDISMLNDGFRSFPSGHASFSFSGLLYLALFFSTKFAISIPYLPITSPPQGSAASRASDDTEMLHDAQQKLRANGTQHQLAATAFSPTNPLYHQAATPSNYGLLLIIVPIGVAVYISSTRYSEFFHFGFDIISGALIGSLSAWFSFRWYNPPIQRAQGWAWGPRTRDRAFAIGVGTDGYVGRAGWWKVQSTSEDVEAGSA